MPVNCFRPWMKECVVCSSCNKKGDSKGKILQWCKAEVLQVFIITNNSDIFTYDGKMFSFFLENTDLLGLCYLINQFAEVGCPDESRSRKLWFLPVAAAAGPGAALGICVCAILLQPLAQLSLVGGHSQEPEQTQSGGFLMLRTCPLVGDSGQLMENSWEFSRRRKLYSFFLSECFLVLFFPPWCVVCFQIIFLFLRMFFCCFFFLII